MKIIRKVFLIRGSSCLVGFNCWVILTKGSFYVKNFFDISNFKIHHKIGYYSAMKSTISVTEIEQKDDATVFRVVVEDDSSSTEHEVTVTGEMKERYCGADETVNCVKRSFQFLLERESKESILRSFELSTIEKYFPEYPTIINKT